MVVAKGISLGVHMKNILLCGVHGCWERKHVVVHRWYVWLQNMMEMICKAFLICIVRFS